jgi:subtilisin family serine protease
MDAPSLPQPAEDKLELTYFQPGEIVYTVSHPGEQLSQEDIDTITKWSSELAEKSGLVFIPRPEEQISFPPGGPEKEDPKEHEFVYSGERRYQRPAVVEHPAFTMLFGYVTQETDDPSDVDQATLAKFIHALDRRREKLFAGSEIKLESVSPNWLASPTKDWGGTGGPGSIPVPYAGDLPPAYKFTIPEIDRLCDGIQEEDRGKNVVVAILDTAPDASSIEEAYKDWAGSGRVHGLIESLLQPGGRLTVHNATPEERRRMSHVHLLDHRYKMSDHGLFVAGIIHSIAPAAEIHLYEVLNESGVGDLKTIADGLRKAYGLTQDQHMVVNCSLVLNFPRIDPLHPRRLGKRVRKMMPVFNMRGVKLLEWAKRQVQTIEWACQNLYQQGARVVAAAGNDRRRRGVRPQADYPAAFDSVLGVGALKKDRLTPASYSNFSDRPEKTGIITLGGEGGAKQGILGIYLGDFPPEQIGMTAPKNMDKWAWWAGTSFATPIMTGLTAAMLSTGNHGTTEQAISALYRQGIFTQTGWGEDALEVKQDRQ